MSAVVTTPHAYEGLTIQHVVTSGTFSLDGGCWDVDNNVYVVGSEHDCVIIDAPHEAGPILSAVGDRRVTGILLTHAHDDHITVAGELAEQTGAPLFLHPEDHMLWERVYSDLAAQALADGDTFTLGAAELQVIHTPGHTPGGCCFYLPALGALLSGDTLFQGGPGATGRSFSSFETIIESITGRLFNLPDETLVLTGHGESTTIGQERPGLPAWLARGH